MERVEKEISVDNKKLFLVMPTIKQINGADLVYSKTYVQAIRDGLKPRVLLEKEYKEAGVITQEDELAVVELSKKLQEIIIRMRAVGSDDDKTAIYSEYLDLKSQYEIAILQKNALFQHSAEAKAETAKLTSLAWQCVLDENKKNIWSNEEEILGDRNSNFLEQVLKEFIMFFTSLDISEAKLEDIMKKFLSGDSEKSAEAKD